ERRPATRPATPGRRWRLPERMPHPPWDLDPTLIPATGEAWWAVFTELGWCALSRCPIERERAICSAIELRGVRDLGPVTGCCRTLGCLGRQHRGRDREHCCRRSCGRTLDAHGIQQADRQCWRQADGASGGRGGAAERRLPGAGGDGSPG